MLNILKTKRIAASCALALLMVVCSSFSALAQSVTGVVKDSNGEALYGVTIRVSNTNTWTVTNEEGKFTINAPKGASLEFSFIGFLNQVVNVTAINSLIILRIYKLFPNYQIYL